MAKRQRKNGRSALAAGLCAVAALVGCEKIGDFDELPVPQRNAETPPGWACLGGEPPKLTGRPIEFQLEAARGVNRAPLSDVKVRACGQLDVTCERPVVDYVRFEAGVGSIALRDDFLGYLEVVADDFVEATGGRMGAYVPTLVFFSRREVARGIKGRRVLMFTPDDLRALTSFVAAPYAVDRPSNAILVATALDCDGETAAGVTFDVVSRASLTEGSVAFYTDNNQLPFLGSTETGARGTFGLTDLNPGSVSLSAFVNPLRRQLTNAEAAVVRDNWITTVFVSPP